MKLGSANFHGPEVAHVGTREYVLITMGKYNEIARFQLNRLAIQQLGHATAIRDEVIGNDVLGAGHVQIPDQLGLRRQIGPSSLEFGVQKHRTGEAYRSKHIR